MKALTGDVAIPGASVTRVTILPLGARRRQAVWSAGNNQSVPSGSETRAGRWRGWVHARDRRPDRRNAADSRTAQPVRPPDAAARSSSSCAHARVEPYRARQEIFQQGLARPRPARRAERQGADRSVGPDGNQVVLNVIDVGDVFGEIALLDGKDRTADAVAMTSIASCSRSTGAISCRSCAPIPRSRCG